MPSEEAKLWPSIFDVLLYSGKNNLQDLSMDAELVNQQVHRNLENLLNCRRRPLPPAGHLSDARDSILMYGIPDFTSNGFDNDKQRRWLCGEIRDVIRNFEPRLKRVVVEDCNQSEKIDRVLRFKITADLQVYPNPHRVVFDSRLDRTTSLFTVQDA